MSKSLGVAVNIILKLIGAVLKSSQNETHIQRRGKTFHYKKGPIQKFYANFF